METYKVTNWAQLKTLVELAQQYSIEYKQYDAPFAVYAVELVRNWQRNNFAFYLLHHNNKDIGYIILHTDATGLNDTLTVYSIFIDKDNRKAGGFKALCNILEQVMIEINVKRVVGDTVLDAITWEKYSGYKAIEKHYVVVDNTHHKE